jgi:hypothetical protein
MYGMLSYLTSPWLMSQLQYAGGLEPQREGSINQLIANMSPGNKQASIDDYRRGATARAQDFARQAAPLMQSQGQSTGATEGAQLNSLNQAGDATNQYAEQVNSPAGQQAALQAILGATGQGQNVGSLNALNPMWQNSMQLYGLNQSQNQQDWQHGAYAQQQLGQMLSQIAGIAAMAGWI